MSIDKKASRSGLIIPIVAALLLGGATVALAGNSLQQIESIRHGSTGSSSVASTSQTATEATSATSQAAQTATMAANAQASLQHSLQVWQAAQAAQSAARTTAQSNPGSVPNGLVTGGLVPDSGLASPGVANPVTTWVNAKTPVQTTSNGETTVTVTQTGQQALLNWQTFNIGATTTLDFDQSAGGANAANWVAINKVAPSIAPSEILGSMKAQGQVYVIDQNGIVFGGASQVNVGALVASSLPINSNLVTQGLLNDPDDQFLFSQLTIPVLSSGSMSAYTPPAAPTGGDGDVVVEAGAQLTSPSNGDGVGGKIALIGPNVTNAGTISTPNGQTILAAGNQVGFAAHDANDPTLRGLDVYVGSVDSTSGTAENNGIINSTEGDVTIAGKTVNQNGVINSSTSVSYNGRVDLEADYDSKVTVAVATQTSVITPTATGTVNFGTDSLTQILPELSSTDTVVGTQLALSSIVNVQGQTINLDTGALLYAPSAALPSNTSQPALGVAGSTLTAGLTLNAGSWAPSGNSFTFANTNGSVTLGQNATIDVSGSENVAASVAEDIVAAQLLGTELADSPLQQNGPLRGKTIDVNLLDIGLSAGGTPWIGTPLADVSGYINLVQHNVGELTTAGGSVAINAGGSVNVQTGSTVNVSGGWINYQGATVQTTKVVSADGQTVDISQADPDQDYTGIYGSVSLTSQKWNTSESLSDPLVSGSQYEPGFIQGGNGGSLTITAPSMTLNGNFFGNTVAGANQRAVASQLSATYSGADFLPTVLATQAIPTAGSLTLNFQGQNGNLSGAPVYSPTPPAIDFGTSRAAGDLVLSPDLVNSDGFGNLTISNGDGSIYVPSNVSLTTSAGGSIAFTAANLDIEGSLSAPDGNLSFNVYDYSPYAETESPVTGAPLETTPPVDPARGLFFLGSNASLSTAGLIVDDLPSSATADTLPLAINGGTITIKSFGIDFALGSTLNVSGGADASAANKVSYGNGGRLSIIAGQDPGIPSLVGNTFTLDSTLIGYSGAAGGSLTIQAPLVQVGGVSSDPASALTLSSAFFTQGVTGSGLSEGGFASFTFDGLGEVASGQSNPSIYLPAVDIAPGVTITPLVQSLEADVNGSSITLDAITQPFASLRTPANVNFDAEGVLGFTGNVAVRGDLIFGAGSVIETDPKGGVSLSGQTVDVQGSIIAPGGTISISGATNSDPLFANAPDAALVTVDIGPDSVLSAAGTTLLTENAQGYRTGSVLAGGKISVSGNILAEAGSELNVSGATDVLDVLPTQTGAVNSKLSTAYVPTRVDSSGGSITLSGGQELFSAATLEGAAGGPSAQGGSLTVKSGLYVPVADINNPTTPLQTNLEVVQSVPSYNASGVGNAVTVGGSTLGTGYFAADSFNSSGLDALTLGGTVQFSGPVQIAANRSIAVGSSGIIYADANVTLTAPYVDLGQAFQGPLTITEQQLPVFTDSAGNAIDAPATYGSGSLTVNAGSLIDVGNLSLQDIGNLNLTATGGDIRGDGTLDVSGAIGLTAGQIYPTTETTFTIAAFDHNGIAGSVNIADSGTRQLPLSAGGTLNVFASDITQGGVLRAPIGTINLGSGVTSASPVDPLSGQTFDSAQQVTLTSGSVTSVSAVDPVTGDNLTIPYGTILDGVSWIDPAGNDITAAGNGANAIPAKAINISAGDVIDQSGATIDLRGGGDLYGYRFVSGTSGTVDILASKTSYAVIPGYSANYAPYYSSPSSSASPSDYTNGSLAVGEQVYLEGGSGLSAGVYTLLPAGYALLPGAYLVTPQSATPPGSAVRQLDGSSVVGGYVFNGLDADQTSQPLLTSFAVASQAVVRSRAEYDNFSANTFLSESAASNSVATPLLPIDAGQLVLAATQGMTIQGNVLSQAPSGGLGSEVDIASPSNIVIDDSATLALPGTLVLDASDLTAFGADSLLIGGYRTDGTSGMQVTVTTPNITVDNAGEALTGPDVILAANQSLTVAANAEIEATGSSSSAAQALVFGNASVAGSGDGVLLRVSSDASAQVSRAGVDSSAVPSLTVDAGATLSGNSLVLDSTAGASIDPAASLSGTAVSIGAGQISLVLDNSQPTSGFVLSGNALSNLQASAKSLSLLSYSSIDIYGSGVIGAPATSSGSYQVNSLELDASEIRGFDGGSVTIDAQNFALDNGTGINAPTLAGVPAADSLTVNAATIQLGGGSGVNTVSLQGYANVSLNGSSAVMLQATPSNATDSSGNAIEGASTLGVSGNLQIATPEITGATGANQTIQSAGTLTVVSAPNPSSSVTSGGLGATLNLAGTVVTEDSSIILPSGNIGLDATNGDVVVGGTLNVSGSAQTYHGLTEYTPGGTITLTSDNGSVDLNAGSTVSVAAPAAGGNAGTLSVSASNGTFNFNGVTLAAQGGAVGTTGSFVADLETISGGSLDSLDSALDAAGFTNSISIRDRTDTNVSLDGTVSVGNYSLSLDSGSITVNGTINASNVAASDSLGNPILVGGTINLNASGSITLATGSVLTVAGQNFNNAGKGGSVSLDAGSEINGNIDPNAVVDIASGSTINLSVGANTSASAAAGDFTGTLQIRAPQTSDNLDLQVDPINGTIVGASSITAEGYELYSLNNSSGSLIDSVEGNIYANGTTFAGNAAAITSRLLANNAGLAPVFNVVVGAEVINPGGDLTLDNDWDLSTFRFGPNNTPGVLTLRAAGNLIFDGSLSDGFTASSDTGAATGGAYNATLMSANATLPANLQSWTYNLTAGADFSAANVSAVVPNPETYDSTTGLAVPGTAAGSLELGNFVTSNSGNAIAPGDDIADAMSELSSYYQVIRTGTGNINIATGGDVLLQNQFASIYTSGAQVADPTMGGTFSVPVLQISDTAYYPAQYSLAGGNVTISAQGNIAHVTENNSGTIVMDSEKELPNNWLYRRGYLDSAGQFGATANGDTASTSWWVDFSNFFEGVGTLGGGNVTLSAGHDVSNVDAVAPTNARMSYTTASGDLNAADQTLTELGGGNVGVTAGNDINGGVYYVERGQGTLQAGNSIITNSTRSASLGTIALPAKTTNSKTWLPTTLFLGAGSFDVTAQNSVLLGPAANPFLLPQGVDNTYWDKTYFSTYAASDEVNVASLSGDVTLREDATTSSANSATPLLYNWLQTVDLLTANPQSVSYYEPWLNITETNVTPFETVTSLLPPTLDVTAFSGDINDVGNLTLSPSATGTVSLVAEGSINGLQPTGVSNTLTGVASEAWSSSTIDLSDADPAAIPGVFDPYAYELVVGTTPAAAKTTGGSIEVNGTRVPVSLNLTFINDLFAESGSTEGNYGVLQTKLDLHADINGAPLHANDPNPVYIYAGNGDISGLTLFSPKPARVVAGQDITDIALYIQNVNSNDISLVSAGRDIIAYDASAPLLVNAQANGNALDAGNGPLAGDIQIAGPGTIEVMAGRNLNLGVGPNNADGTGVGLTSIGNQANPVLPFAGADIVALAGVGDSAGLNTSNLVFTNSTQTGFIDLFLDPTTGGTEAQRYLPDLGGLMGLTNATDDQIWAAFSQLSTEKQDDLALDVFYLVLRDAGRDHNDDASAPGALTYAAGFAAINALFPSSTTWQGDISLTSREIKTENGGDISLLAPGGALNVGLNVAGTQPVDQGILTEDGGNINIFTNGDVNVGTSRIFTLNGGNEVIWSSYGGIDAGASSKTVQSAPPTRVLVDPQSGAVQTDLAGLATGGGIGVLETRATTGAADVDLIAPHGDVNAGDAGIRASGNLNIAAVQVLNASNIMVGGKASGVPTASVSNVGALVAGASVAGALNNAANEMTTPTQNQQLTEQDVERPSIITVEVLGYGGSDDD